MNTADYWPMACKYSIWNATIASLQFWTENLDPVTLGIATECVYTTFFFYTSTSHTCEGTGWVVGICSPMLIPRQLRFSLYSGAVITEDFM